MTAPVRADQDAELREAWVYLTPHPLTNGPVVLDGPKMRAAIATIRAEFDQLTADLRKAVIQAAEHARARGEAEGRLRASEMAGVVEGWREQNERLAAELREVREDRDRLRDELSRRPPPYSPTFTCPKCSTKRGWFPACMQDGCPLLDLEGEEITHVE